MNSRLKPGGLQSPLTEPTIIPLVLRCHNRLHDGSLGYVDRGIPIIVMWNTTYPSAGTCGGCVPPCL